MGLRPSRAGFGGRARKATGGSAPRTTRGGTPPAGANPVAWARDFRRGQRRGRARMGGTCGGEPGGGGYGGGSSGGGRSSSLFPAGGRCPKGPGGGPPRRYNRPDRRARYSLPRKAARGRSASLPAWRESARFGLLWILP